MEIKHVRKSRPKISFALLIRSKKRLRSKFSVYAFCTRFVHFVSILIYAKKSGSALRCYFFVFSLEFNQISIRRTYCNSFAFRISHLRLLLLQPRPRSRHPIFTSWAHYVLFQSLRSLLHSQRRIALCCLKNWKYNKSHMDVCEYVCVHLASHSNFAHICASCELNLNCERASDCNLSLIKIKIQHHLATTPLISLHFVLILLSPSSLSFVVCRCHRHRRRCHRRRR